MVVLATEREGCGDKEIDAVDLSLQRDYQFRMDLGLINFVNRYSVVYCHHHHLTD